MKIKKIKYLTITLILIVSFLFPQEKFMIDYRIGPKDLLEISVFGVDDLNKTVRVSEKGKITLPLLGEVEVKGLTKAEIEKRLSSLLVKEDYLHNPQVTVFISEYRSKEVSLLGAVMNPGSYELLGEQSLLKIISQAGGFAKDAGDDILVIRQHEDGTTTSLKISIEDLVNGDAWLNIPIQADDIINISLVELVHIYVFGQVNQPGALEVRKKRMPNLLQAIAQAGGFSERASKGKVLIRRVEEDGREIEIKVNVKDILRNKMKDVQLKEGDVVFVPETIF